MSENRDLSWWLDRLEQMQPDRVELGLERITRVSDNCGLSNPPFSIITVAGTNGKGSTVAFAADILNNTGSNVGVYTSPHFIDFNERIVVDGQRVSDQSLCSAFAVIDAARDGTELTYFEFTTLAAMVVFHRASIDVAILEVGLGGRLDAVNAWDCDVACITSIGIDHTDWLGDDRESIGREKAGVARSQKPLICGEPDMPVSIEQASAQVEARLLRVGREFNYRLGVETWQYNGPAGKLELPLPAIRGDWVVGNASVAITACAELMGRMPAASAVSQALQVVSVPGRMQHALYRSVPLLLDVAHNPQAASALARFLRDHPQPTTAVFSCLKDKDAAGVVARLAAVVDRWMIAPLDYPRAFEVQSLLEMIRNHTSADVEVFASVIQALEAGVAQSQGKGRIVVFGSFHVVGPVLKLLDSVE